MRDSARENYSFFATGLVPEAGKTEETVGTKCLGSRDY
jgi:hypothetical protein